MKNLLAFIVILLILVSGCTKTTYTPTPVAIYSLDSSGICMGANVSGRYVADTALSSANTVSLNVDVSVIGPYWITTNTVNGMSFNGISTFVSTGSQTVVLTGSGTPDSTGAAEFTVTKADGTGGGCTFSVTTVQGIPPNYYLTCLLNGIYTNFSDSTTATNSAVAGNSGLAGLEVMGKDTIINSTAQIDFGVINTGFVGSGLYTDTSTVKAYFNYVDSLGQMWSVVSSIQPSFTIAVTSASTSNIQGTFSGMLKNDLGTDSIFVSNGLFSLPLH
jgi:hypothetical protein